MADTKEEALQRLKAAIDQYAEGGSDYSVYDDVSDSETPREPGLEYLRVYFNVAAISVADIDTVDDADHEDKGRVFHNYYACPDDQAKWEDANCDAAHDDKCPTCNAAITPYKSDVYDADSNLLETIDRTEVQHAEAQESDGSSNSV